MVVILGVAGCNTEASPGVDEVIEPSALPASWERWLHEGHAEEVDVVEDKSAASEGAPVLCGAEAAATFSGGGQYGPLLHFHNVGDLDGDGHDDLLVVALTSHGWPLGGTSRDGRAFLFHGPITPERLPLSLSDADAEFRLSIRRGALGTLVVAGGDLSGNGFGDLVIGTPLVDMVRRRGHASFWPSLPGLTERWNAGAVFILEGGPTRYSGVVDVEQVAWRQVHGARRTLGARLVDVEVGGYGHGVRGAALGCTAEGALVLSLAGVSELLVVCGEALRALSGPLVLDAALVPGEGMALLRYPERQGAGVAPRFGFSRRSGLGHHVVLTEDDLVVSVPVAWSQGNRLLTEVLFLGLDLLAEALWEGWTLELDEDADAVRVVHYQSTRRRSVSALHALPDGRMGLLVESGLSGPSFVHSVDPPERGAGRQALHDLRFAT